MVEVVEDTAPLPVVEPGQQRLRGMERGAVVLPLVDRLPSYTKDSSHLAEGFRGSSHVIQCRTSAAAVPQRESVYSVNRGKIGGFTEKGQESLTSPREGRGLGGFLRGVVLLAS